MTGHEPTTHLAHLATKRKAGRVFLLSPANLSGRRAKALLGEAARFELAIRLRLEGAPLGDVFSFVSGLYFRGKLAYAKAFSDASAEGGAPSVLVITATNGLLSPSVKVNCDELREMSGVPISSSDSRYRAPLERDAMRLAAQITKSAEVVLLGSIATPKYLEPLSAIFGDRLMIPVEFMGRGDMSRGSLMLRAVRSGVPLEYMPASRIEVRAKPAENRRAASRTRAVKLEAEPAPL
jgi:hypothetical protein